MTLCLFGALGPAEQPQSGSLQSQGAPTWAHLQLGIHSMASALPVLGCMYIAKSSPQVEFEAASDMAPAT